MRMMQQVPAVDAKEWMSNGSLQGVPLFARGLLVELRVRMVTAGRGWISETLADLSAAVRADQSAVRTGLKLLREAGLVHVQWADELVVLTCDDLDREFGQDRIVQKGLFGPEFDGIAKKNDLNGSGRRSSLPGRSDPDSGMHSGVNYVAQCWNQIEGIVPCKTVTDKRRREILARFKDRFWREHWLEAIDRLCSIDWIKGRNERGWVASIDWFIRPNTVAKILEGAWDDRSPKAHSGLMAYAERHKDELDVEWSDRK